MTVSIQKRFVSVLLVVAIVLLFLPVLTLKADTTHYVTLPSLDKPPDQDNLAVIGKRYHITATDIFGSDMMAGNISSTDIGFTRPNLENDPSIKGDISYSEGGPFIGEAGSNTNYNEINGFELGDENYQNYYFYATTPGRYKFIAMLDHYLDDTQENYEVTITINSSKQDQASITYSDVTKTYGDDSFAYTAAGGSGTGAFSYASSDTSVATINSTSGSVTILKPGTTTLTATRAEDINYSEKSKSCTLTVNKANQAAIIYNDVTKACGDAPFPYTATGGSGTGAFSYTSSDPAVAAINPLTGSVSILKVGTTTLTATKAADTNYNSANKGCTLTVNKGNQAVITYNDVTKTYGDAAFVYTASAGSGTGAFSYNSSEPAVATIDTDNGTVKILKAGTTTLTAIKAGDSNYNSASKDCTLTVNKGNQAVIAYNDVTKAYGDADFVYTASGGSGTGTLSYTSSDPAVATINPSTGSVRILKVGTTTLTATKAGDSNYNEVSDTCTLTVNKGSQAAIIYNDVAKAYGDAPFTCTASGGSGIGDFSYTSSDSTVATIDPSTGSVSILKAGTTTLTAAKAADTNYGAASKGCTLTVNKAGQVTITYDDVTKTYGDASFTYTAAGGSGTGTFSYTSSDTSVATINSTTGSVTILKAGTTTLTASKAADANYNTASNTCTLTVNKADQGSLTYNDVTKAYGDADFVYTASGGSGTGTLSYISSDPAVATINPSTGSISILKVGTTTLTATKAADTNYNSANKGCTLTVNKGNQAAIAYNDVTKTYGDADFVYTATGGSGTGAFSYNSSEPTVATIDTDNGTVKILKAGTTTLTAIKAGDSNYNAASDASTLTVNKGSQAAITYNDVAKAYGDAPFTCTASGGSGIGDFSYTSSDSTVATIDPSTGSVSILKAGSTTLTATKAGDANFNEASKTCTLTVSKAVQSISVTTLPVKTAYVYGEALDVSGGAVTITFTDSSTTAAALTSEMCSVAAAPEIGTRTVTVTHLGHTATFDVTYSKAPQTAPSAPVLSVTASGITVTAPVGDAYEYSKDDGASWQASVNFTGLTHAASYTITVRLKETAARKASNASSGSTAEFMDITAPSLTAGTVSRTSDTAATVKFTSDEAGEYYCSIVADGAPAPVIDTSGSGISCTTAEAIITKQGITTGAKDIYIKVKDTAGNVSEALKIDIPAYVAPVINNPATPAVPKQESEPKAEEKEIVVLVNGKAEDAGKATTTTDGNKTTTTVVLDEDKLAKKLEQEADKPVVTIPVASAADVVVGELNGQMVKNMEKKEAVVEVKTETAVYTLPAQQINIDAVSYKFGKDVELKDIKVQIEISTPSADVVKVVENSAKKGEFTIVAPPINFTVKCTNDNKTVEVSKFNAYVERTVAVPDGVDPSKITTGIVIEPDGTVRHVPTKIIIIDGKYYAKINSLTNSTYSVVWNPIEFRDVENHRAKDDINDMGSRMVVNGDGNGNYNPESDITRAEFAAIVVRALGLTQGTGSAGFTDVSESDWYSGYVKTAVEYKIITGYGNGKFGPMDKITREQAITMIARAMKITGLKVDLTGSELQKMLGSFSDSAKIAQYSKLGIALCIKTGIISSDAKLIEPKVNITRAEVAVFVKRLLQKSDLI